MLSTSKEGTSHVSPITTQDGFTATRAHLIAAYFNTSTVDPQEFMDLLRSLA
jgi:hypothetical protein